MSENEIKPVLWDITEAIGFDGSMVEDITPCPDGRFVHVDDYQSAIDRLTAERDAAVADAARWQELCRQIDAGTFPSIVIDDAMAMGAGALELQVDAARAQERKE